jgi:predicted acyltransferase
MDAAHLTYCHSHWYGWDGNDDVEALFVACSSAQLMHDACTNTTLSSPFQLLPRTVLPFLLYIGSNNEQWLINQSLSRQLWVLQVTPFWQLLFIV